MFSNIRSKIIHTVTYDKEDKYIEFDGEQRKVIKIIFEASDNNMKEFILDELDDKREYHDKLQFSKKHIRNIFKNMYINKDIMKWLDDEGYVAGSHCAAVKP